LTKSSKQSSEELAGTLAEFIQRTDGAAQARQVRIEGLRLLTGGASRQTWSFDAVIERADGQVVTLPLILRSDPQKGARSITDRATEYGVIAAAHAEGVPVPKPYLLGDDSLGVPFFLMERIEGEVLARRLLRDEPYREARRVMPAQLAAALARIHRIPLQRYDFTGLPTPAPERSPAEEEIDRFEQNYRSVTLDPHPTFELALRWLRQRLPRVKERVLVHGDFRIGNVMFGPEGVRAILDWEGAHIGDPMEDLGWLCVRSWRFGSDHLPVGGIGTREEFQRAYEEAGGSPVDPEHVRFWEIFGNLRWGILCVWLARPFMDGRNTSVELGAIGRRAAETEWELLALMEA